MATGVLLLSMLSVVPIWNSISLLSDDNYVFWAGQSVPIWLVFSCVGLIILYIFTITTFFAFARPSVQTEQTVMMIANIFVTMLGLILMLVSLPLSRQSIDTYNNLMHRCDSSDQTHRMFEYSQVLHHIRQDPACLKQFSVETCEGYGEVAPYTELLKSLEKNFRCSGFCYRPPTSTSSASRAMNASAPATPSPMLHAPVTSMPAAPAAPAVASAEPTVAPLSFPEASEGDSHIQSLASLMRGERVNVMDADHEEHVDQVTQLTLLQVSSSGRSSQPKVSSQPILAYPPTLFSDANYQASCEGMAARDMRNFAGDVGFQTFYQGIYLVLIAIATGFLKLVGFCVRRDVGYTDEQVPFAPKQR